MGWKRPRYELETKRESRPVGGGRRATWTRWADAEGKEPLSRAFWELLACIVGIAVPFAGLQKWSEGKKYGTISVVHLYLLGFFDLCESSSIECPTVHNPLECTGVPLEVRDEPGLEVV